MHCEQCRQDLSFSDKHWTKAQKVSRQPNVGGRNECKTCYGLGPRQEDWLEINSRLATIRQLSHRNADLKMQNFVIAFVTSMSKTSRKDWSYRGLLPVRLPTDWIQQDRPKEFDPTNEVYALVLRRETVALHIPLKWSYSLKCFKVSYVLLIDQKI